MGAVRIAVVGAGSAQFSLGLIKDLCLEAGLRGSSVVFMDIDEERLDLVHKLANRYTSELGTAVTFGKTTDRIQALEDADFVINTASTSHEDDEQDRWLAEQHGYYRGTRQNANRNMELMLSIAKDMERLCPAAWLLQSANPVFDGCTLMHRESVANVIGLCHGHFGYRRIARVLDLDPDEVRCEAIGVNHSIWATHLTYRGADMYQLLDSWIETEAPRYWASHEPAFDDVQMSRAAVDQYRFIGLMGIGDTVRHTGWQYHSDLETKQRWFGQVGGFDSEFGWADYLARLDESLGHIHRATSDQSEPVTRVFPPSRTTEQHVPIINSIVNDVVGTYQVNVANRGSIPGIADDVVVDVPASISASGVSVHHFDPLPRRLMLHVLLPKILEMERHVNAIKDRDGRLLLSSLLWDSRTDSSDQAEAYLRALLDQPHNADMKRAFDDLEP